MDHEAHVRIDEGVERGPRRPPAAWPQRQAPTAGKLGPDFDPHAVLERYLNGEELDEIAATLGVHPKALNYHLLKEDIRQKWRDAQVAVSLGEYHESKRVVRDSQDALSLARAREIMRSAQWDLERLENRLFGQKQEVKVDTTITINVDQALVEDARELLASARGVAQIPNAALIQPIIDIEPSDNES